MTTPDAPEPVPGQMDLLGDLADAIAVCVVCGSRVALPYDVGAEWTCSLPCRRLQAADPASD